MLKLRLVLLAALITFAPHFAAAQTPADSAGVLLGVATRLNSEGRVQLSRSILDLIIERYHDTPAAAEATRLRDALRRTTTSQSGRTELMVFGTTYGLWLGVAIPAALDANDAAPYGIGLIAGGPAGFAVARSYARRRSLSVGQARAITFGGTWGTLQGLGWANVFDFGADNYCYELGCYKDDSPSGRATIVSMLAGGVAGIGVGTALSHRNITPGTATAASFGGMWGAWYGLALSIAANTSGNNQLASALIAGNAGVAAAAVGAPKWNLSRQRARLISISGVAGALAGAGLLLISEAEGDRAILVPAVTSAAGLGLGAYWTRAMSNDDADVVETGKGMGMLEPPSFGTRTLERVHNGRIERVPALTLTLFQAHF